MLQRLIPSINVPRIPLGDDHMRPVTLRGLRPIMFSCTVSLRYEWPISLPAGIVEIVDENNGTTDHIFGGVVAT